MTFTDLIAVTPRTVFGLKSTTVLSAIITSFGKMPCSGDRFCFVQLVSFYL